MNTNIMEKQSFHQELQKLMNEFVHRTYDRTSNFPREELFGVTSQLRRASLSVVLNYIEGFARQRKAVMKNFLEISYGSLKEAKYLIQFSSERKYLSEKESDDLLELADRIGRMLWGILKKL